MAGNKRKRGGGGGGGGGGERFVARCKHLSPLTRNSPPLELWSVGSGANSTGDL